MPVFHLDIEAFLTHVECLARPELAKRPLVIAPQVPRALVLAACGEAKRLGIYRDLPLELVRKEFPELQVVPPNYALYSQVHREVLAIAARFSPIVEPIRFGHTAMDMTGMRRLYGNLENAALKLCRELESSLGLHGTVGIAANKLVSTIAAKEVQKNHEPLCQVPDEQEARFLAPLPCKALPEWSVNGARKLLFELNLRRIEQIQAIPRDLFSFAAGELGTRLHRHAMGIDPCPVMPPRNTPSLVVEQRFEPDTNDDAVLHAALYRMTESLCYDLRAKQLTAARARLELRYTDEVTRQRQFRFAPTQIEAPIHRDLLSGFNRLCDRRQRVRVLRLTLEGLNELAHQHPLFGVSGESRLATQLDQLRKRFGAGTVMLGKGLKHTA